MTCDGFEFSCCLDSYTTNLLIRLPLNLSVLGMMVDLGPLGSLPLSRCSDTFISSDNAAGAVAESFP